MGLTLCVCTENTEELDSMALSQAITKAKASSPSIDSTKSSPYASLSTGAISEPVADSTHCVENQQEYIVYDQFD